jgi:thiol-disulfide isomerase/thioredoxin
MTETHLYDFYGEECPPCQQMHPLVEKLEKELKIKVNRLEVWHNEKNAILLEKYDQGKCGGVPFFINTKTKKFICGATSYDKLKEWAQGE